MHRGRKLKTVKVKAYKRHIRPVRVQKIQTPMPETQPLPTNFPVQQGIPQGIGFQGKA